MGEHAAATILNNTGAVMVFGGTRDRDDLHFWSTFTGERDERILTTDLHGRVASRTVRKVPVLAPAPRSPTCPPARSWSSAAASPPSSGGWPRRGDAGMSAPTAASPSET
jgi:hypothetical protein